MTTAILVKCLIQKNYGGTISEIVMPFGQVLISTGITAMVFERFGYADYTTSRVCDALSREEVLNVLSEKRKKELKDILFEDIYLGCQPEKDPQHLVHQIDDDMGGLLADYYYDEHHTFCDIYMFEDKNCNKYFRKEIQRTFTAKPIQAGKECKITNLYNMRANNISGRVEGEDGEIIEPVSFKRLYINDVEMKKGTDYVLKAEPCRNINYSTSYEIEILKKELLKDGALMLTDGELRVEMDYTTYVSSDDLMYSVTVDKPCKSFFSNFNCNIPNYKLRVKSYGFMAFGSNTRRINVRTGQGVSVRFRSWILLGDGAVAMIAPEKTAKESIIEKNQNSVEIGEFAIST